MVNRNFLARLCQHSFFPWFICGVGALFYSYEYFLRVTPSVMVQQLQTVFNIGPAQLGVLSAFYYYAYDPMQIPVGVLMDRFGPRRLLTLACLACTFGSYLFTVNQLYIAEIGRFMVGFGSAFAFVGVLKLATIWLPARHFALASGLVSGIGMLGAMGGDIALTKMVAVFGWESTVIISAAVGFFLTFVIWLVIRDKNLHKSADSVQPQSTFQDLLTGIIYIVKHRQIWINGLIGCFLYVPLSAFAELWGIPFLQHVYNFSSMDAAGAISIVFLGFAIGGTFAGWLSDHIGRRILPLQVGSLCAALIGIFLIISTRLNFYEVYMCMFLLGAFSGSQIIVFAIARESSPENTAGTSLAMTNFLIMLGGVALQPVIGRLLERHAEMYSTNISVLVYSSADYRFALLALPVSLVLGFFLCFLLKETYAKQQVNAIETANGHFNKPIQQD